MLSSRGIRRTLFNSALYEFEDVVAGFDEVDLFTPTAYHGDLRFEAARFAQRAAAALGRRGPDVASSSPTGLVMLGAPPDTAQFAQQLPWPEAVIVTPVDAPGIGEVIAHLDEDPERVERIRACNIAGSLRRHDWVYRWELVLGELGLRTTAAMAERRAVLEREADRWEPAAPASPGRRPTAVIAGTAGR